MSFQSPTPSPSFSTLARERAISPPNTPGAVPATESSPIKKTIGKKRKNRVATRTKPSEPTDSPSSQGIQYSYEPYRKADSTPEPERSHPADSNDLETLNATTKTIYKSDREVVEYIEAINHRTAAILECVNRTGSQLRSYEGVLNRMELFVSQQQNAGDGWAHQQAIVLGSDEEGDHPNPDPSTALVHREDDAFSTVGGRHSGNTNHHGWSHDYTRSVPGGSTPKSPYDRAEEDFFRPETPPARQPSLPPGCEDDNAIDYAEDILGVRSDFAAPPDHAAIASEDSTFNRSGADLRIVSDPGFPFPPPGQQFSRLSKGFMRESMDTAVAHTMRPATNLPHSLHTLTQSYIPPPSDPILQSVPQHLVPPLPVLRTPSPSRIVPSRKRKRFSSPEDEESEGVGNLTGPSAYVVQLNDSVLRRVKAREGHDRFSAKRRRLNTPPNWDPQVLQETGSLPAPSRVNPPTRESTPEPSPRPEHESGSLPPFGPSPIQEEGSGIERPQDTTILRQVVEQGESDDEGGEPTGVTQPKTETPAQFQVSAGALAFVQQDVFGPIVYSAKASKISDRLPAKAFEEEFVGDAVASSSKHKVTGASHKSTQFLSPNGKVEKKKFKVYRKTPIRPRTSLRTIEAENGLVAEAKAEGWECSPEGRRAARTRTRKQKVASPIEPAIDPEDGLPSASVSGPPSKLRRGRSETVRPQVPLPKTPVRKSTRIKKKI